MNKEEIFLTWTPTPSIWSPWVKPVLFSFLDPAVSHLPSTEVAGDVSWAPPPGGKAAIVLDLPGAEGVLAGIALASRGYRPVPLYNAVPMPFGGLLLNTLSSKAVAAVNVLPIASALRKGAENLAQLNLASDAPPVFLLDANRLGAGRTMKPGDFDNRSIVFTTDFPSANFFASHGIQRVILVQKDRVEPQSDLAHSLRRWQDAGFMLEHKQIDSPAPPAPLKVARPSWYGAMFQRVLSSIGLRRSRIGGFGAWVPDSSAGG